MNTIRNGEAGSALAAGADDLNTQAGDLDTRGTGAANDSLVTAATAASSILGPGFGWPARRLQPWGSSAGPTLSS